LGARKYHIRLELIGAAVSIGHLLPCTHKNLFF
jgi:hypothetical protein